MPFDFEHNSGAKARTIWGGILLGVACVGEIVYVAAATDPEVWLPVLMSVVGTVGLGLSLYGLASAYTRDASGLRDLMINNTNDASSRPSMQRT